MQPILELDDVTLSVPDGNSGYRPILDAIRFRLDAGRRWSVVGRSGSGKSTLLKLCNRFLDPDSGTVRYRGQPIVEIEPRFLRRRVAMVAQEPVWLPGTARDNLLTAVRLGLIEPAAAESRLPAVLELARIDSDWLERDEDSLSVGQRQRVVLGRALLADPEVLLLDEPASALDPPTARRLIQELRDLGERCGVSMLMVTHRLEDARIFSEESLALDAGRVLAQGATSTVLERVETLWQAEENDR